LGQDAREFRRIQPILQRQTLLVVARRVVEFPVNGEAPQDLYALLPFQHKFWQIHLKRNVGNGAMQTAQDIGLVTLDINLDKERHSMGANQLVEGDCFYGRSLAKIVLVPESRVIVA
jgi:hypothetical protein